MRILVIGNTPSTGFLAEKVGRTGHTVTLQPNLQIYKITNSVHAVNPELVLAVSPLPHSVLQLLTEHNVPVVGWSLWSDALQVEAYQNKLLLMLEKTGLVVRNGGLAEEFNVTGWWDGVTFSFSYLSVNRRHLMNGEHGPLLESAWSCSKPLLQKHEFYHKTLEFLLPFLNRLSHRGPVTLHCILHAAKPAVVRISAGFNFDSDIAVWEVTKDPVLFLLSHSTQYVPIGMDSFGTLHLTNCSADMVVESQASPHTSLAGGEGCISARGRDWREVRRRLYRTSERLQPSTIAYRTDFGVDLPAILS